MPKYDSESSSRRHRGDSESDRTPRHHRPRRTEGSSVTSDTEQSSGRSHRNDSRHYQVTEVSGGEEPQPERYEVVLQSVSNFLGFQAPKHRGTGIIESQVPASTRKTRRVQEKCDWDDTRRQESKKREQKQKSHGRDSAHAFDSRQSRSSDLDDLYASLPPSRRSTEPCGSRTSKYLRDDRFDGNTRSGLERDIDQRTGKPLSPIRGREHVQLDVAREPELLRKGMSQTFPMASDVRDRANRKRSPRPYYPDDPIVEWGEYHPSPETSHTRPYESRADGSRRNLECRDGYYNSLRDRAEKPPRDPEAGGRSEWPENYTQPSGAQNSNHNSATQFYPRKSSFQENTLCPLDCKVVITPGGKEMHTKGPYAGQIIIPWKVIYNRAGVRIPYGHDSSSFNGEGVEILCATYTSDAERRTETGQGYNVRVDEPQGFPNNSNPGTSGPTNNAPHDSQFNGSEPTKWEDHYATLVVPSSATAAEIAKAYRKISFKHHPDKCPPEKKEEASNMMILINNAYEVLKDEDKKNEYDKSYALHKRMKN